MPNQGFINLLPLNEKPVPNVGETYLRARAMADQNALAQQESEMNALKIQDYKESRGANNALARAKGQGELSDARLKTIKYLGMQSDVLNSIYDDQIKNGKTPEEAAAIVQPHYEKLKPIAAEVGISGSEVFDPVSSKAFVRSVKASTKSASEPDIMTTPQYFDETSTGGKPGIYFPTREGKPGSFVRKATAKDLKEKGDDEKQWQDKNRKLIDSYSEDNPDIPRKVIETMIPRAIENKGGLESSKSLDGEMELLLNQYRTKDKSYLPTKRMTWPPFGGKGTPKVMDTLPDASEHKGKIIKELDAQGQPTGRKLKSNGKSWIQAMNANDVSLGSGTAGQAKSLMQLRKELNDAYLKGDDQRAAEIERQIQEISNQSKNVG